MNQAADSVNQVPEFMLLAKKMHDKWIARQDAGETLEPASPQPVCLLSDHVMYVRHRLT